MPLVAWAVIAWVTGILGAALVPWAWIVPATGIALAAWRAGARRWERRWLTHAALAAIALAGAWSGVRAPDRRAPPAAREDGWLPALRARAEQAIDRRYALTDAPVVKALLIADQRRIDPAVRDAFADAGLVHVLSISGMHVAIVIQALTLAVGALRVRRRVGAWVALAVATVYVALIGAPPPAVRALAMSGVGVLSHALQRPTSPWAALAIGAAFPLLGAPATVFDLGWQLSVVGMAALIAGGMLAERVGRRWPHGAQRVGKELVVGLVAGIATAPLIAWWFGRIPLVAPLTNLLAAPIVALLQPALFLALIAEPIAPVAQLAADAAAPLVELLTVVATLGARVPGGVLTVAPSAWEGWVLGAIACAVLAAAASRAPARPLILASAGICVLLLAPMSRGGSGLMELHLLDVGQGDAIALRTPRGRWVLVDAGGGWEADDVARRVVLPYLRARGGEVVAVVASHPHADHVGGLTDVLRATRPARYLDGAFAGASAPYQRSLLEAQRIGTGWERVRPGDTLALDGLAIEVLAPDSAWTSRLQDPNLASVVLRVRFGARSFLLTGDAEAPEEEWLVAHATRLKADVLKVAHHGSATSTTDAFLAAVQPSIALISVGARNRYGHPAASVERRLRAGGAEVHRTDQEGTIVVSTDGQQLRVTTATDRRPAAERP
ncbi:MAG: DNA internalization-related competence protein ComEC/Rec2 [Gemmatimonadaceae bacterium]|nr:DNA internalization-related competence protein ComEC/Rec2 [Gemmatimonadaceae bacterium]